MPRKKKENQTLYEQIYFDYAIQKAWQHVYQTALSSQSLATQQEARNFKENDYRNIVRIKSAIGAGTFEFKGNKGLLVGKKLRPLVLAPIENRIVQRSILNVLQSIEALEPFYRNSGSFGALKSRGDDKKGVPAAIISLVDSIKSGASYYLKSDIKKFFTDISRTTVIGKLRTVISDEKFLSFLDKASNIEIENINSFDEKDRRFFIYDEVGTPQGCCLSPLFGNILLHEFDACMNTNDITCLRYLDDFIILGPDRNSVKGIFGKGLKMLEGLGLSAYKLDDPSGKSSIGRVDEKFEFLGIEINSGKVRPTSESKNRLFDSLNKMISYSLKTDFSKKIVNDHKEKSLIQTLYKMNNKVKGWGNQYYFCNDIDFFREVDDGVDEIIKKYLGRYADKKKKLDKLGSRRLLGIHLVTESKFKPVKF